MKRFITLKTILLSILLISSFTTLYALEDQFEISATVVAGGDVTAPSVPTALSATAVSSSQINLSWTASTDNVAVTGYRIYRDNVFLTTSVSTSHSDTGLSASTAYAYAVSAIDAALNESARSATSTATTFAEAAPESGGGGSSGGLLPIIYDVVITPTGNGASITWKTRQDAIANLSWGLTSNYELGQSAGMLYEKEHSTNISGLLSGTAYLFAIEAISGRGVKVNFEGGFQTLITEEGNPNPTNFTAKAREKDILLSWKNPITDNFEEVRLVRQNNFYPSDPSDGEVIYEGGAEEMMDENVKIGVTYYYALFAKSKNGEFSSGALAKARILVPGEPIQPEKDIFDSLPKAPAVHPLIDILTFLDFDFIQDGIKLNPLGKSHVISIDGGKNLTVSLDYKKVPEVLKSMVVTLTHPTDKTRVFSFLLRVNEEKTAYAATIAPLGESGNYEVKISIVDYKNRGLKKIIGNLLAIAQIGISKEKGSVMYLSLFLLLILVLIYKSFKKLFQKNKRKEVSVSSNA